MFLAKVQKDMQPWVFPDVPYLHPPYPVLLCAALVIVIKRKRSHITKYTYVYARNAILPWNALNSRSAGIMHELEVDYTDPAYK